MVNSLVGIKDGVRESWRLATGSKITNHLRPINVSQDGIPHKK